MKITLKEDHFNDFFCDKQNINVFIVFKLGINPLCNLTPPHLSPEQPFLITQEPHKLR